MNFKQFETLYWVSRLGSFRAASRHLKMTQPTVSARIRELERELGVELFDRSSRSARLTPKGRDLLPYSEQVVALASRIHQEVGSRETVSGRVRLGVTGIPARTWLGKLLRDLGHTHPGVEVEVVVESSEHLRDLLLAGELDAAFLAGPFPPGGHMVTDVLGKVTMALLASPSLGIPLATCEPKDLQSFPIISGPRGSDLYHVAEEWFRRGGVQLRYNHACSSLTTRIHMAVEGLGIAVATPSAAARELGEGKLRIIATGEPLTPLEYLVAFPLVTLSPAVQLVAAKAKELVAEKPDIHFYYSADRGGLG
jgi:DNA-binding transcriptional LysR family regulator